MSDSTLILRNYLQSDAWVALDIHALAIGLSRLFGRRWKKPVPISLDQSSDRYLTGNVSNRMNGQRRRFRDDAWQVFEKSILKLGYKTGLARLAPARPAEFGILVKMTR